MIGTGLLPQGRARARARHCARLALLALCAAAAAPLAAQPPAPAQGQPASRAVPRAAVPAYLVVELQTGRRLAVRREDVLRTAVPPGSLANIATLLAAVESHAVEPGETFLCRRRTEIDGETIICSHPALGRPLTLAEALAHSCHSTFAAIASRLRREDFDRALVSLGLPPSDPAVSLVSAALGLRGVRATPEQMLNAFVRAVGAGGGVKLAADASRPVLVEGLQGAATYGTAAAIKSHGVTALAKTGTAPIPGGRPVGLVVAVAPADRPTVGVVVVAPGAVGVDAVGVAADRLQEILVRTVAPKAEPIPEVQVRMGKSKASGRSEVETIGLEEYVARVVAADAVAGGGLEARKAEAVVGQDVRPRESRPSPGRGFRRVRPAALPEGHSRHVSEPPGGRGDPWPGAAIRAQRGLDLLHAVMRRPDGTTRTGVEGRRRCGLPPVACGGRVPRRLAVDERNPVGRPRPGIAGGGHEGPGDP